MSSKEIKNVGKVIVVASGKGGVGKSTIASNLAVSLAQKGHKTGIVDLDIHGPSIAKMFGVTKQPDIDESGQMIPIPAHGVVVQSIGLMVGEAVPIVWRGPMVSKAVMQMLSGTNYDGLDYLIIDTPPGTGDIHLSTLRDYKIDGVVMVSTPQDVAMLDVFRLQSMLEKIDVPVIGLIENMSYYEDDSGNKQYLFGKMDYSKISMPILGKVPIMPQIAQSGDDGSPICVYNKKLRSNYNQILDKIISYCR